MDNLFKNLKISNEIKSAIKQMGFKEMTPIQALTIPKVLEGKDVIGQAQTGTGKTLAFGIPLLEHIFIPDQSPQAIVICPTRELCLQVSEELSKLTANMKKLKILSVYGGQAFGRQSRVLKKGVHVIVGTPGRIMDHLERGTLDLSGVTTVVLDEADVMLDMGFRDDMDVILKQTPKQRQTLLFSATVPKPIKKLAKKYQKDPKHFKVNMEITVPETDQVYYVVTEKQKIGLISTLTEVHNIKLSLIFCNTKRRVDRISKNLRNMGYNVGAIHGDMTQKQRDNAMNKFRKGKLNMLVATDVVARGIDVPHVDAVFNHDIPADNEFYIHRIGRTGRAGQKGLAFNFVRKTEVSRINNIQNHIKRKIRQEKIPSMNDIEEIKTGLLLDKIKRKVNEDDLAPQINQVESLVEVGYNPLEISAAMFKILKEKEA